MKVLDVMIFVALVWLVSGLVYDYYNEPSKERQLILAAEQCWDQGDRAVYIRVEGEYRIRCEP